MVIIQATNVFISYSCASTNLDSPVFFSFWGCWMFSASMKKHHATNTTGHKGSDKHKHNCSGRHQCSTITDRSARQKYKQTHIKIVQNFRQMDLKDIHIASPSNRIPFFSAQQGTFSKVDHMLAK